MKANEAELLGFLKNSTQFVIPIYQRTYSWTEAQCLQLWDDILRVGSGASEHSHFIGSIVYITQQPGTTTNQSPVLVIDGQQRLTTISLLIEAIAHHVGDKEPLDGFSAEKLRSYYLCNPLEKGERNYKLILTQTDKESLFAIVRQKPLPDQDYSIHLKENFDFFKKRVAALGSDIADLCRGLAKLMVVDVKLFRDGGDNPQLIFESLNSTGLGLSQTDLIRNFILMGLEPNVQEQLYLYHWRHMEIAFGQEAYEKYFDGFMRHYLTAKTHQIPNINAVYEKFKIYAGNSHESMEELVFDIHTFSKYYCKMALGKEENQPLAVAFADLRELEVDVAYPLLLDLYNDYANNILSAGDFEKIIRLIESYVFRRVVCGVPTNTLNKTFASFGQELVKNKNQYWDSIQSHFVSLSDSRRFPSDDEFSDEIKVRNLYDFRRGKYYLRKLENHEYNEPVPTDEYTIEHIMPQNKNLSKEWQLALGDDWKQVQEIWLHTLGNLTLTGYNPELSDRPFAEKRDIEGGFGMSPLKLNQGLGKLKEWNKKEIKRRANRLAQLALRVWVAPLNIPPRD